MALALIRFPDLNRYEKYRDALMSDPSAVANVQQTDASGCIIVEDRFFLRQVP